MDIRSSLKVPTAPSRQNRIVAPEILRLLWPKITSEHDPRYTCHKNGAVPPPIMVQWTWPMLCNQVARQRPSTHVLHLPTGILLVGCLCPNMYPKHTHVALSHQEAWWNMLVLDETWLQKSCWYLASEILWKVPTFCAIHAGCNPDKPTCKIFWHVLHYTTNNMTQPHETIDVESRLATKSPHVHLKHIFFKHHMESGQS